MNKNGEFSESKINLYLNQNNLKKRTMQIRNKLFDPSEVLEKKRENFRLSEDTKIRIKPQGEATI